MGWGVERNQEFRGNICSASFCCTCIDNQSLAFRYVHYSHEVSKADHKMPKKRSCPPKNFRRKRKLPSFHHIYPAFVWRWTSSKPPCKNFEGDLWQISYLYGSLSFPFWQHQTPLLQWSNSDQLAKKQVIQYSWTSKGDHLIVAKIILTQQAIISYISEMSSLGFNFMGNVPSTCFNHR